MVTPAATPYPIEFRQHEVHAIFDRIVDGDSLSIVGIGTVGKTQLIGHIATRGDVQAHYLQRSGITGNAFTQQNLVFLHIDPNSLLDPDPRSMETPLPAAWPGYELILRRIVEAALARDTAESQSLVRRFDAHYMGISDRSSLGPQRAYQVLERAIYDLFHRLLPPPERVIIIFDEFNKLVETMPDSFFINLRALRDQHRYRLVYIATSRLPLRQLFPKERHTPLEPFIELFRSPLYLGPYTTQTDMENALLTLYRRKKDGGWQWPKGTLEVLHAISGGHSGLVRTCFEHLDAYREIIEATTDANISRVILAFLGEPDVIRECQSILQSVSAEEQKILNTIASTSSISFNDPAELQLCTSLHKKHLLMPAGRKGRYQFSIPLLGAYLARS